MLQTARRASEDLRALGVRRGGPLLVHSSLSSLGRVPGGAETVIRALLEAVGEGLLLMPALSYASVNTVQRLFSVRDTPSCVGAIPEAFRTRAGTLRSVHPTHSVCAVGTGAEGMLGDHILDDTPVGPHSPFRRVRDLGGQVLFLGCGMRPNTSMHGVEELVEPPYLFAQQRWEYHLVLEDGSTRTVLHRRHAFHGWRQRYDRLEPLAAAGRALRRGRVLAATCHLIEAGPMWEIALARLRQDALYFVEREGGGTDR
jgi:aminoglycoside 3-N-acetyltransferase